MNRGTFTIEDVRRALAAAPAEQVVAEADPPRLADVESALSDARWLEGRELVEALFTVANDAITGWRNAERTAGSAEEQVPR